MIFKGGGINVNDHLLVYRIHIYEVCTIYVVQKNLKDCWKSQPCNFVFLCNPPFPGGCLAPLSQHGNVFNTKTVLFL